MAALYYSDKKWLYLLAPFAWIYRLVIAIRRFCYRKNFFKQTKLSVPVIVVGNITLGGTGKTPLVIYLAEYFKKKGKNPGIISRGYRSTAKHFPQVVTTESTAIEVGDEPLLIHHRTQCPVVIDPNRVAAANYLLEHFACDVIISDDGLQHYALMRDLEIAVVDAQRYFGNGFCLPAGPLREPVSRLNNVDLIILNGLHSDTEVVSAASLVEMEKYLPIKNIFDRCFAMQLIPQYFKNLQTQEIISVTDFVKKYAHSKIHALAGIGNPQRFFNSLSVLGLSILPSPKPDHHHYQLEELNFDDDYPIVMTEKDAVKCLAFANDKCWYLEISADLSAGFCDCLEP